MRCLFLDQSGKNTRNREYGHDLNENFQIVMTIMKRTIEVLHSWSTRYIRGYSGE